MDLNTPVMFENIKIEADSDCAFFGLSNAVNDGSSDGTDSTHLDGFPGTANTKLSTLLSSVSPFTISSSSSNNASQAVTNTNTVTEDSLGEDLFTNDIVEQLELDLPEFTCDFDLLEDDGFMDATNAFLRDDSDSKDSGTSSTPDVYHGSPSVMDSPPLTPPSPVVKVETETKTVNAHGSVPTALPMLKNLPFGTNLTKILPALKTSRGRSASHDSPDVQALKRHIRMIRNRESASLSRKKKKEYVTSLEERLRELEIENSQLKQENQLLKTRLLLHQQSTAVNQNLASKNSGSPIANNNGPHANRTKLIAKVALLGVCCFMILGAHTPNPNSKSHHLKTEAISNVSTQSKVLQGYDSHADLPHFTEFPTNHLRLSRSLAWHDEFKEAQHKNLEFQEPRKLMKSNETTLDTDHFEVINKTRAAAAAKLIPPTPRYNVRRRSIKLPFQNASLPLSVSNDITDIPIKSNCKASFNKTESLRVQNDLKGLFSRGKPKKKNQQHQPKPFLYSLMDINSVDNNKGLTVYDQRMQKYSSFLEKINLREDTFYVVSLAMEDQLLLSAKSSNASSRPKMSFLMPWKNDSVGGKEEVMQIDCEVTKVLNLKNLKNLPKAKNI